MALIRKTGITLAAIIGLAVSSQAPEFTQQYHQRLGGALGELENIIEQFDQDAREGGYSRDGAISVMQSSTNTLIHKRGISMQSNVSRHQNLLTQNNNFTSSPELLKPYFVFQNHDEKLAKETWSIFKPAIPLTLEGFIWGGIGALLLGLGYGALASTLGRLKPNKPFNPNIPVPVKSNLRAPKIRYE